MEAHSNSDEFEAAIKWDGGWKLRAFGVETTAAEVLPFFLASNFLKK